MIVTELLFTCERLKPPTHRLLTCCWPSGYSVILSMSHSLGNDWKPNTFTSLTCVDRCDPRTFVQRSNSRGSYVLESVSIPGLYSLTLWAWGCDAEPSCSSPILLGGGEAVPHGTSCMGTIQHREERAWGSLEGQEERFSPILSSILLGGNF